ncbi:hypothetical protein AHiyo4_42660 [Arthrobacter sp. Hiyo4]|nr:hypothetical protein AHiyo4_42660 [Arthrobacter sp. Hiyo4]
MFGLTVLDLALILALLSYLTYGLRNGFLVTLGGIAGFAAGAGLPSLPSHWSATSWTTPVGG